MEGVVDPRRDPAVEAASCRGDRSGQDGVGPLSARIRPAAKATSPGSACAALGGGWTKDGVDRRPSRAGASVAADPGGRTCLWVRMRSIVVGSAPPPVTERCRAGDRGTWWRDGRRARVGLRTPPRDDRQLFPFCWLWYSMRCQRMRWRGTEGGTPDVARCSTADGASASWLLSLLSRIYQSAFVRRGEHLPIWQRSDRAGSGV